MNMYNLMTGGPTEIAPVILKMLGMTQGDVPRYRDAYIEKDGLDETCLVIFTRTGGGNREEYEDANNEMAAHPEYIKDEDDDFDSTYAHFWYHVPKKYKEEVERLYESTKEQPKTMGDKFEVFKKGIENKTPEQVREMYPEMSKIVDTIAEKAEMKKP